MVDSARAAVGQEIARRITPGEIIGVGTGSTVEVALQEIGKRITREKFSCPVVPTSYQTAWLCQQIGLQVLAPNYNGEIAWGFDGADEVDSKLRLIKGGGGALLQEKIVAARCRRFVVICDEQKIVTQLGERHPVPIEVIPEAIYVAQREIKSLGATELIVRQATGKLGPVITERGNIILDAKFPKIPDTLDRDLKAIVGVVETGLFFGFADEVLIGGANGVRVLK